MDLVTLIRPVSDNHTRYILALLEYPTRFLEAVTLSKIDTEIVAGVLIEMYCRIVFPEEILSDVGTLVLMSLMRE